MIYKFLMIAKSGRCPHRRRRSVAVGVPANRDMVNENSIFRQPLTKFSKINNP